MMKGFISVKFVKIEDTFVAIFPNEKADFNGNVMSYDIVGGWGGCHKSFLSLKPVFDMELYLKLREIYPSKEGYLLVVMGISDVYINSLLNCGTLFDPGQPYGKKTDFRKNYSLGHTGDT